jgi:hypothetical protein
MYKKPAIIPGLAVVLLLIMLSAVACTSNQTATVTITQGIYTTNSPTGTVPAATQSSSSEAEQVLTDVISAMGQVSSFSLYSDIFNTYQVTVGTETSQSVSRWVGTRSVDLLNKQMYISMKEDGVGPLSESINYYLDPEYSYGQTNNPNSVTAWTRSAMSEEFWNEQIQLPNLIELLSNSSQESLLSSDVLDGQPCYVLNFLPSAEAAADWVIAQTGTRVSYAGPVLGDKDMLVKAYRGGVFELWIASDSYLVLQASFSPVFEATAADFYSMYTETPSIAVENVPDDVRSDFSSQMLFSGYNQTNVEIPAEALNAPLD